MCYPSPGPRCSRHAQIQLSRCKHALERAKELGNTESIERAKKSLENATLEFFTTPKGHKYLQAKISAGEDASGQLQKALDNGIKIRKQAMKEYKASIATPVNNTKEKLRVVAKKVKPFSFTASELRSELNGINESGDRLFVPQSLTISESSNGYFHIRYDSYVNGPCVMNISQDDQSMMGYKDYGDEEEEEVTSARPMLTKQFSDFQRSKDYGTTDAEIVANNLADVMETLEDDKINWNKDSTAVSFMYFGEAHADVNRALRKNTYFNKEAITTLDKIMSKDTLTEDTVVYRGIRDYDGTIKKRIQAGAYRDKGYISMTVNPKIAKGFSGGGRGGSILMTITLPAGTKCADLREDSEAEIALPRDFDLSNAQWKFFD